MAYIDRGELIVDLVRFEKERKDAGDDWGAHVTCACRGIVLDQRIIKGLWIDDVCDKCKHKVEGAMAKHYEWCPICGAEMCNEWEDEDEDDGEYEEPDYEGYEGW